MANREREGRQKGCKRTQTTAIDVRKDESATSLAAVVLCLAFDAMGAVRSLSVICMHPNSTCTLYIGEYSYTIHKE